MHQFFLFLAGLALVVWPAAFIGAILGLVLRSGGAAPASPGTGSFDFGELLVRLGALLQLALVIIAIALLVLLAFVHPLAALALVAVLWFLSRQ